MGFKIIKDNIHTNEDEKQYSLVGKEYDDYKGGKHRYRVIDGDGHPYFYILSDTDVNEGYENELFAPLDKVGVRYGCTDIEYKEDGEYKLL